MDDDRRSTTDPAAAGIAPGIGRKEWVKRAAKQRLPEGGRGRAVARSTLTSYREAVEFGRRLRATWTIPGVHEGPEPRYPKWLRQHAATPVQLASQRNSSRTARQPVTLHVVVLPGPGSVAATLDSLRDQTWTHWQASVCMPGGAAAQPDDARISIRATGAPGLPRAAEAADEAVGASAADFVIMLAAGDRLAPECLYTVASTAHQDPLVDLVHWDDDLLDEYGRRAEPRFRPAWSPDMLLSANYLGRSFALRRSRYRAAGGLRVEAADTLHWDLLLRCGLDDSRVARVARVLGSVAARDGGVPAAGVWTVQDHLDRTGAPGVAAAAGEVVRVEWRLEEPPHVTVVIPTRHNRRMLGTCLHGPAQTDYPSFDVTLDNGGRSPENERWYAGRVPSSTWTC